LGQIAGLGAIGYRLALDALARLVLDLSPEKSLAATSSKKGAARNE
jgi:hypothetical protein